MRPLDRLSSIKLKLGVAIVAAVAVGSLVSTAGLGVGIPLWIRPIIAAAIALAMIQVLARGMTSRSNSVGVRWTARSSTCTRRVAGSARTAPIVIVVVASRAPPALWRSTRRRIVRTRATSSRWLKGLVR